MYKLKEEHLGYPAGTVVYECVGSDYGCASDDSRIFGVRHISVTVDPKGSYPFFTVPKHKLLKTFAEGSTF